jgi:hypothetical protein
VLLDFSSEGWEEDRDTFAMHELMKKYQKLWRNIFSKYQNVGFKATNFKSTSFESLQNSVQCLSLAEITKMLKDHDVVPQLMTKDEVTHMVRLINMNHSDERGKGDLQTLVYSTYT